MELGHGRLPSKALRDAFRTTSWVNAERLARCLGEALSRSGGKSSKQTAYYQILPDSLVHVPIILPAVPRDVIPRILARADA